MLFMYLLVWIFPVISIVIQVKILKCFSANQKIIIIFLNGVFCIISTIIIVSLLERNYPIPSSGRFEGMGRVIFATISSLIKFIFLNHGLLYYLNNIKQKNKGITAYIIYTFVTLLYVMIISTIEYFFILELGD